MKKKKRAGKRSKLAPSELSGNTRERRKGHRERGGGGREKRIGKVVFPFFQISTCRGGKMPVKRQSSLPCLCGARKFLSNACRRAERLTEGGFHRTQDFFSLSVSSPACQVFFSSPSSSLRERKEAMPLSSSSSVEEEGPREEEEEESASWEVMTSPLSQAEESVRSSASFCLFW